MEVTGYQLKEALKMKGLELATVSGQFDDALYAFEDEKKAVTAEQVAEQVQELEAQVALLQTAQSYYNLQIEVEAAGAKMTLEQAIKMVGGAGRISKMWRSATVGRQRQHWDRYSNLTRRSDEETAQPTVTRNAALQKAIAAEKIASALRNAIALGNATKVEVSMVDESLLG